MGWVSEKEDERRDEAEDERMSVEEMNRITEEALNEPLARTMNRTGKAWTGSAPPTATSGIRSSIAVMKAR